MEDPVIRILIVDDDAIVRTMLSHHLQAIGKDRIVVSEADCGAKAHAIVAAQPVDCVLLDYQMPGGDGLEWLVKLLATHPNLAIVMVTGEGSERVAVEAMKMGAVDYLNKIDLSRDGIRRAVTNALEQTRLRAEVTRQREELLDAERQRVLLDSLGTACHHIGQPAQVLLTGLEMMQDSGALEPELVDTCIRNARRIADVLRKLQQTRNYRTKPYLTGNESWKADLRLLDI